MSKRNKSNYIFMPVLIFGTLFLLYIWIGAAFDGLQDSNSKIKSVSTDCNKIFANNFPLDILKQNHNINVFKCKELINPGAASSDVDDTHEFIFAAKINSAYFKNFYSTNLPYTNDRYDAECIGGGYNTYISCALDAYFTNEINDLTYMSHREDIFKSRNELISSKFPYFINNMQITFIYDRNYAKDKEMLALINVRANIGEIKCPKGTICPGREYTYK